MLTSGVCLYVLLFYATRIMYGQATMQSCSCDLPDPNFATGINLLSYECNMNQTISFPVSAPQRLLNVLERDKQTIIYVFGYLQYPQDPNVEFMMKALCYGRTDNVVLLDWSKYSTGLYPLVFKNAEKVGSLFARSIRLLKNDGFDVSKLHIIGHSLGSHIAGFSGKCNKFVIPRITALDPANPVFYPFLGCYLTEHDAAWIDVIHTDMGGYGSPSFIKMGTADYFANSGIRPQPGCEPINIILGSKGDMCSHQISVRIYAKSKDDNFTAVECPSYLSFTQNFCDSNLHTGVGYKASNVTGTFYFETKNI